MLRLLPALHQAASQEQTQLGHCFLAVAIQEAIHCVAAEVQAMLRLCTMLRPAPHQSAFSKQGSDFAVSDRRQPMCVAAQVQVMLRLYTMLLPALRQAALQSRPSWATASSVLSSAQQDIDSGPDEVLATVRQEAAAVLNVGQRLHSEGQLQSLLCCMAKACLVHKL